MINSILLKDGQVFEQIQLEEHEKFIPDNFNTHDMNKNVSFYVRIIQSVVLMSLMQVAVAQGLYSNTSQSTQYVRMLSRNASTAIDAVYYNPAGLAGLSEGWHFAINDQVAFQTNVITNNYPVLNDDKYSGKIMCPLLPSAFGAYKMGNFVFSLGAGISAGGGLITYERGLPSFEIPVSRIVPDLTLLSTPPFVVFPSGISGYTTDIYYENRTFFPGFQAGVTYRFNKILSGFAGIRYISGSGTFYGYINDSQLIVDDNMYGSDWLSGTLLPQATGARTSYNGMATSVQQLIIEGAGSFTLAQVHMAGYITYAQRVSYESALSNLGLTSAQIAALTMNSVYSRFTYAVTYLNSNIVQINTAISSSTDKELDVIQAGAGWTPVLGINLNMGDKINVGVKYEFLTKLALVNNTTSDDFELYPDNATVEIIIPSMFALGIGYKPMDLLEAQLSFSMIFDKSVNWGLNTRDQVLTGFHDIRERVVEKNTWEIALGLQYKIRNDLALSAGCMTTRPGVDDSYQSAFGFVSPSVTVGAGLAWEITDMLTLDAGIMNTFFQDVDLTYFDVKLQEWNDKYPAIYSGNNYVSGEYTEKLSKRHLVVSAGITYSIIKTEK